MSEQDRPAADSPHVHRWVDKALLHEPPLKVCACGATMTDTEYRDSPNRDERDRASDAARVRRPILRDHHGLRIVHCHNAEPHTWHGWVAANEDLRCPGVAKYEGGRRV